MSTVLISDFFMYTIFNLFFLLFTRFIFYLNIFLVSLFKTFQKKVFFYSFILIIYDMFF